MKRIIFSLLIVFVMILSLCSCSFIQGFLPDTDGDGAGENPDGDVGETPENPDGNEKPECSGHVDGNKDNICDICEQEIPVFPDTDLTPVIFLAGDSTVKTYEEDQYIGGWGQFFELFLGEKIVVKNAAHGGRSSRSFINEGRLFDIPGSSYTFSQNGGNSIGDEIKEGDYLFIQFGHNDDASKLSNYSTIYDRMVPLGEPDANGIYPVTPAEKQPTTFLPTEYTDKATDSEEANALQTLAKYGSEYYAFGSGTYKWYLKQYIDFAREKGAIPVLVTPVARVKFSGGEIIGGAGLHGENFAYVEAVRQLAEEEDCLLIDLFASSKTMLETATSTYANYLMALKPNELTGEWPLGYDAAYGNVEAGYTGIEATHYNKYGAFLQAAFIADHILQNKYDYSFSDHVHTNPESYIDPSNLIGKNTVVLVENLFDKVSVTNPDRAYIMPETVVALIDALAAKGEVTGENYLDIGKECEAIRLEYAKLNVDFKHLVTNIAVLEEYEAKVEALIIANRPEPVKVVIFNADDLTLDSYSETVVEGDFTLVATSDKKMDKKSSKVNFTYGDTTYSMTYGLSVGGKASFGSNRYISFTVEGPCTVTVAVRSSGSDTRTLTMVDSSKTTVGSFEAPSAVSVSSVQIDEAGSYSVGSAGSGMYIYMIIIEYFE
ncbi:MAG: hypothetical protein IJX58_00595 [Clostridia bacterium]|nr:hypothetical protein [Clostridia bacterium]